MLDFVKKAFHRYMDTMLWVNLIMCAIVGGVIGNSIGGLLVRRGDSVAGYVFLGLLIGALVGMLQNILFGGYIATIISIDKNLKKVTNNLLNQEYDYVVIKPVYLRPKPNSDTSIITVISEGENLMLLEKGEKVKPGDDTEAHWVKIQSEDDEIGWCSSENLKEV